MATLGGGQVGGTGASTRGRRIRVAVCLALVALGVAIYFSPETIYGKNPVDPTRGVTLGRQVAFWLFTGNRTQLQAIDSQEPALSKFKSESIMAPSIQEEIGVAEKAMHSYSAVSPDPEDIQLYALKRVSSFMVMTFGMEPSGHGGVFEAPGRGPMYATVGMRYFEPDRSGFMDVLLRKMANLPLVRHVGGGAGPPGMWVVIDFSCPTNCRALARAVLAEPPTGGVSKSSDEDIRKMIDDLMANANEGLQRDWDWVSAEAVHQAEAVDALVRSVEGK